MWKHIAAGHFVYAETALKSIQRITDLTPDDRNANKGTPRGAGMLRDSLQRSGFGRPVLVDRNGKIIAGNKTIEEAVAAGFDAEEAIVVRSNGRQAIIHIREDLSLDDDPDRRAQRLAIADNRTGELSLDWDAEMLAALVAEDDTALEGLFSDDELAALLASIQLPDVEFREYDESVADEVQYCECPECGHRFPNP